MGMSKTSEKEQEVSIQEMIAAQAELDAVKRENGITVEERGLSRLISGFFNRREAREKRAVNRKKYLLLAVFTGWLGGHRFYARQYPVAALYLLLFWTGLPFAMTLIDLMIAIPMPADEEGRIWL